MAVATPTDGIHAPNAIPKTPNRLCHATARPAARAVWAMNRATHAKNTTACRYTIHGFGGVACISRLSIVKLKAYSTSPAINNAIDKKNHRQWRFTAGRCACIIAFGPQRVDENPRCKDPLL